MGGLGLNSGIGDTYDITWKLAAVLKGYGGKFLLDAYDPERRMVSRINTQRVEDAMGYFMPMFGYVASVGEAVIHAQTEAGEKARADLATMIDQGEWVHSQEGTWGDYRYNQSPICVPDPTGTEPERIVTKIVPSVWPGCRAPHVFLKDGTTSIFDLYGADFNIVDFTPHGEASTLFLAVAKGLNVPIKRISLPHEKLVHSVWKRDAVLLRPDGHVAWCAPASGVDSLSIATVKQILSIATGQVLAPGYEFPAELKTEMFLDVAPEERLAEVKALIPEIKTGKINQLEDRSANGV